VVDSRGCVTVTVIAEVVSVSSVTVAVAPAIVEEGEEYVVVIGVVVVEGGEYVDVVVDDEDEGDHVLSDEEEEGSLDEGEGLLGCATTVSVDGVGVAVTISVVIEPDK